MIVEPGCGQRIATVSSGRVNLGRSATSPHHPLTAAPCAAGAHPQPPIVTSAAALAIVGLVQAAGVSRSYPNADGHYPDASRTFSARAWRMSPQASSRESP